MNLLAAGLACLWTLAPVMPGVAPDSVTCDQQRPAEVAASDTQALIEELEAQGLTVTEIDPGTAASSCTFNPCSNQGCFSCVPCGSWQDTGETTCQLAGTGYAVVCTTGTIHKRSCPCCGPAGCDGKTGTNVSCM